MSSSPPMKYTRTSPLWSMPRTPRVLVADDESDVRHLVSNILIDAGAYVDCADDGQEVIEFCSKNQYDLLILDILMPKVDGFEVFRQIRRNGHEMPVIFLSALSDQNTIAFSLELGAIDYIWKPFQIRELIFRIRNALRLQSLQIRIGASCRTPSPIVSEKGVLLKVLFLAANPKNTNRLRLDEEARAIDRAIRKAKYRDKFEIRQEWAVRNDELQECLLRHEPHVVHFSGHGSNSGEIVLESDLGTSQTLPIPALGALFGILKDNVSCVVLNACYSESQAQAIAEHIDCVIGVSRAIEDAASIRFSAAFYQAVAYGRDVLTAFNLACLEIRSYELDDEIAPKLLAPRINPGELVLVGGE